MIITVGDLQRAFKTVRDQHCHRLGYRDGLSGRGKRPEFKNQERRHYLQGYVKGRRIREAAPSLFRKKGLTSLVSQGILYP